MWLPAFAGRLQNIVRLEPITAANEAVRLSEFYLTQARAEGKRGFGSAKSSAKPEDLISKSDVEKLFAALLKQAAAEKAQEGVTPRDLLNALNARAEAIIANI